MNSGKWAVQFKPLDGSEWMIYANHKTREWADRHKERLLESSLYIDEVELDDPTF